MEQEVVRDPAGIDCVALFGDDDIEAVIAALERLKTIGAGRLKWRSWNQ